MFLSLATLADVALRDSETRMDEIMRTQPVRTASYFAARFAGAYAIACLAFLGAALGIALASRMPWVPAGAVGPFRLEAYALAVAVIALPNLFATGALFFTVASLTRSLLATYLSALVLFILYIAIQVLLANPAYRTLGALSDPFGNLALLTDLGYWTNAEFNNRLIPFAGLLLWNRLLWISIGILLLALSIKLFNARERRPRAPRIDLARMATSPVMRERPVVTSGGGSVWDQIVVRTRHEAGSILRSWTFLVLLVLGPLACVGVLVAQAAVAQMPTLPVTYVVIDSVAAAFALVAVLVPIAYGGELIWRDRNAKIAEIVDATPTPNFVFLVSKIAAVALVILALLCVVMVTGIAFQLLNGVTDIEIGFYLVKLLLVIGLPALMFGVFAILVQSVVNQKYLGLLILLAVLVALPFASYVGIENKLFVPFELPDVPLSDLNRYGHFLARTLWFAAYWLCVAVLIAIAAHLVWVRGAGSLWTRMKRARHAVTPAVASLAGVALAGTAASGGYIYWNTHVLNEYVATGEGEQIQVDYEKSYRKAEKLPQPRIAQIELNVDLYPDRRGFRSRGRYALVNRSDRPIETVHVLFASGKVDRIELQDADLADRQPRFNVFEFRPRTPFAPGETRMLTFTVSDNKRGFQAGDDVTPVLYNGSWVQGTLLAPLIGVQRRFYLKSDARRRAFGLDRLPGMAARDDPEQRRLNFISTDSDFIRFAITVSTSADQVALAPGNLEREWTEGDRKFFRYGFAAPIVNFWSVVSARYVVARDTWNDVELAVYYEPKHGRNVPRMLDAMKQALAYYAANFGPYPHRNLRIAEFPRIASATTMAQSFATLIPYSEAARFIANLTNPASIDLLWHITAHEVAHQWWAHQVIGANVEGAQFLSESLAEYSALMVAEHRYGTHKMRQLLKYDLDTYLRGRGRSSNERPLARAAMDQFHVHYQKGALALYALKDAIGEAAVNRALARLVREHAYKSDPYPTSSDLLALLRAEAGPAHDQLITDLFEKITLWDLRVTGSEATEMAGGKWRVRVEVRAKKLEAAGNGQETEVPLDQLIDVGLFAADPAKLEFSVSDVIVLEKRPIKTGTQTIEFIIERKPAFVGIDPYVKLISRDTSNNVAPLGRQTQG
jgi:ABC-2 type transport system permease protein